MRKVFFASFVTKYAPHCFALAVDAALILAFFTGQFG